MRGLGETSIQDLDVNFLHIPVEDEALALPPESLGLPKADPVVGDLQV